MASWLVRDTVVGTRGAGFKLGVSEQHMATSNCATIRALGTSMDIPRPGLVVTSCSSTLANWRDGMLKRRRHHQGGTCFKSVKLHAARGDDAKNEVRDQQLTVKVVEYFMLLEASSRCSEEDLLASLGEMWTLQYLVPNVLCASAGGVVQVGANPAARRSGTSAPLSGFTHALHFRFGNVEVADAFRRSDKVREATAAQLALRFDRIVELAAVVEVPNELGAIFRRGGAWEAGVVHVLLVECLSEDTPDGAAQYLAALGELAASSGCGALLSSFGPVAWIGVEEGGSASPMLAMITQVPSVEGASAFVGLSPVKGLLDGRASLGIHPLMSLCFEVAPTEGQRSNTPADGRLP